MPRRKLPMYKQIAKSQEVLETAILNATPDIQDAAKDVSPFINDLFEKLGAFYRNQSLLERLEKGRKTKMAEAA